MESLPFHANREQRRQQLRNLTKKELFAVYCNICLGRVHSANIKEMRRTWMIEDILRARGL